MYDDLKKYAYWIPFLLVGILIGGWILLRDDGIRKDDGPSTVTEIKTELDSIANQQRKIEEGLNGASKAVGNSTHRNNQMQNRNHDDATIIRENQQIIEILIQRAKSKEQ